MVAGVNRGIPLFPTFPFTAFSRILTVAYRMSRRRPPPPVRPTPLSLPAFSPARLGRELAGLALLLAATFAAYFPAWQAGFIWNDSVYVTAPALRSGAGLWRIWTVPGAAQQYYPLLHSAFWIEHRLWGDSATGYHLFNILLHG